MISFRISVVPELVTQGSSQRVYLGAIAGVSLGGTVTNCTSRFEIDMTLSSVCYIGGIVGANFGEVSYCINEADMAIHGAKTNVGGIVASNDGSQGGAKVNRCFNLGSIAGEAAYAAGVACYVFSNNSEITNCYNSGDINAVPGSSFSAGGICGYYNGTQLKNCYNTGTVAAQRGGSLVGEIGYSSSAIYSDLYYLEGSGALGGFLNNNTPVTDANDIGRRMTAEEMKASSFVETLNGTETIFAAAANGYPSIIPPAVNVKIEAAPDNASVSIVMVEGGSPIAKEADGSYLLLPGDYLIEAGAADYQTKTLTHTVSYDSATHTIKIHLDLLPADYAKVDEALAKIPGDLSLYTDETAKAVTDAKEAVVRGKFITEQAEVDAMAKAIMDAIQGLEEKPKTPADTDDSSHTALIFALFILSGAMTAGTVFFARKRLS